MGTNRTQGILSTQGQGKARAVRRLRDECRRDSLSQRRHVAGAKDDFVKQLMILQTFFSAWFEQRAADAWFHSMTCTQAPKYTQHRATQQLLDSWPQHTLGPHVVPVIGGGSRGSSHAHMVLHLDHLGTHQRH